MRAITKFVTNDGREFNAESEALAHESCLARVQEAMADWPPDPDAGTSRCDFANGRGYIQLSESLVIGVRDRLLDIIAETIDHKWVAQSRSDPSVDCSWVGRLLDDYRHCAGRAWYQLACVDSRWRWWGQPYYRNNPSAGTQAPFVVTPAGQGVSDD
jgi:hypothetical protein